MKTEMIKTEFSFKEIKIPSEVKEEFNKFKPLVLKPMVDDLYDKELINSFHFIFHENLDLRLSSLDWDKNKKEIEKICKKYIPSKFVKFKDWFLGNETIYGGGWGVLLCYNNLEFNSRLILYMGEGHKDLIRQWKHYLTNQAGIKPIDELYDNLVSSLAFIYPLTSRKKEEEDENKMGSR